MQRLSCGTGGYVLRTLCVLVTHVSAAILCVRMHMIVPHPPSLRSVVLQFILVRLRMWSE